MVVGVVVAMVEIRKESIVVGGITGELKCDAIFFCKMIHCNALKMGWYGGSEGGPLLYFRTWMAQPIPNFGNGNEKLPSHLLGKGMRP